MQAAEVLALRAALESRFPNAQPVIYRTAGAVATGVRALDALLPGGGLPRGRLVLWEPGGGATAMLRMASATVIERGERSAWVDAQRVVTGDSWVRGPLLLRPANEPMRSPARKSCCAAAVSPGRVEWRGARARGRSRSTFARGQGRGGAFVALAPHTPVAHMRLNSQIKPDGYKWKLNPFAEPAQVESVRIRVEANAMGWSGHTELTLPVHAHTTRVAADPLLRDRRGAKRRTAMVAKDKCERRR
jgi:hypothetical protein